LENRHLRKITGKSNIFFLSFFEKFFSSYILYLRVWERKFRFFFQKGHSVEEEEKEGGMVIADTSKLWHWKSHPHFWVDWEIYIFFSYWWWEKRGGSLKGGMHL
jgi:hypothetical protein